MAYSIMATRFLKTFLQAPLLILLVSFQLKADENPIQVYKGCTPIIDGFLSPGEYADATELKNISNWFHFFNKMPDSKDLNIKAWIKHDGNFLYFAFDITDDIIYGIDIPRWTPDSLPNVHTFSPPDGWPWFGDGVEIFMTPYTNTDISAIDGKNGWIMACSTHKSHLTKLGAGGLIEGEPRKPAVWDIYRKWIEDGRMMAKYRLKSPAEGKGYIIEWQISPKTFFGGKKESFWPAGKQKAEFGINIEVQDLDEKEKGVGNFANINHVEVLEAQTVDGKLAKKWGKLILVSTLKPDTEKRNIEFSQFVNPFIGTLNFGNTNPGAVVPWGMYSVSPFNSYDTISKSVTGPSPYYFGQPYISGFTSLHLSGVGCGDLGTFCIMPTTGELSLKQSENCSSYSAEKATPGYYSVYLNKFDVTTELSATPRSGILQFSFPEGQSNIILNLGIGLTQHKGSALRVVSPVEVEGYKNIGNFCGIKSVETVYFVVQLGKTPVKSGVWIEGSDYPDFFKDLAGENIGAYFTFSTKQNEQISIKIGVSYQSIEGARQNLEAEQSGFDFQKVKNNAVESWEAELSRIKTEGGTYNDKVLFYSALYHTLLHPSVVSDVNDLSVPAKYHVFSLWDAYRTAFPFLSLVYPEKQSEIVQSMLSWYKEEGLLPKFVYGGIDSYVMVGDPAVPVIADTYLRGIKDFDIMNAYQAIKKHTNLKTKNNLVRPGYAEHLKYGYIPFDEACVFNPGNSAEHNFMWENINRLGLVWGPASTSLEYCIADWNASCLAGNLGFVDDSLTFRERALSYRNLFDKNTGFMRPKLKNGQWLEPFDTKSEMGFTEGNAWTYSFMVPFDVPGLINLMGGQKNFANKLTQCFEEGHFFMGNEPDITYPFLFNYIKGQEWKTQKYVRQQIKNNFKNAPDGIPGNDDCGTMSAWLMFSMLGIYPDCIGSMDYQLTSPVFDRVSIMLNPTYYPGKSLTIETKNCNPENYFIKSMKINGEKNHSFNVNHKTLVSGAFVEFELKEMNTKSSIR